MADQSVGARDEFHESEASWALMFCFDNVSPEKACFVVNLVWFISLWLRVSVFLNDVRKDTNLPTFKFANITHALPVPVYRQTDFTPKWVVVSRLHDTVARFRTGVTFSPRCENRGELTPG